MPLHPVGRYVSFRKPATSGCEIAHLRATEKKMRNPKAFFVPENSDQREAV
jgi:hypothetical protein